jgi:molybdopterin/thiamine biosynthesis adenylyltransferase
VSRYTRQIRLREIGEGGQARLEAAEILLGGEGVARDVERAYLRLAGAMRV